jgi:DNA-binding transcriptional ArsR family regulator
MSSHDHKGRFAFPELDRVLHERARLGILSCMISCGTAVTFAELKDLCDLTDGNLSRHLKALEEDGVVELEREKPDGEGSRPQTRISFTRGGRKRFLDYVEVLDSIVRNSAAAKGRRAASPFALGESDVGRVPA